MSAEKDDIEKYRDGSSDNAKRHALEKRALKDSFLEDALEGAHSIAPEEFSADLQELSKKIQSHNPNKWFMPLRIAAGIVILLSVGAVLLYYRNTSAPNSLALEKSVGASSTIDSLQGSPKDTVNGLLSLAKPEKTTDEQSHLSTPKNSGGQLADESELTKGASDKQKIEAPVPEETRSSGEESKEVKDDKEDLLNKSTTPLSTSTGGANDRSEKTLEQDAAMSKRAATKKQDAALYQNFVGTTSSANNGSALQGVNVIVQGTAEGAVTDNNGNYQIVTQAENPQLIFSGIGLKQKEVKVPNQSPANIQLLEDRDQRSEISVAGQGAARQPSAQASVTELAFPLGGRFAFQKYLEAGLRYPSMALANKTEGLVVVQFTVKSDGSLINFQSVQGIGNGCEEELIRLIQDGPKWIPTQYDSRPAEDRVSVLLRFSLPR